MLPSKARIIKNKLETAASVSSGIIMIYED